MCAGLRRLLVVGCAQYCSSSVWWQALLQNTWPTGGGGALTRLGSARIAQAEEQLQFGALAISCCCWRAAPVSTDVVRGIITNTPSSTNTYHEQLRCFLYRLGTLQGELRLPCLLLCPTTVCRSRIQACGLLMFEHPIDTMLC